MGWENWETNTKRLELFETVSGEVQHMITLSNNQKSEDLKRQCARYTHHLDNYMSNLLHVADLLCFAYTQNHTIRGKILQSV
jgi:hypothetical protein